MPPGATLPEWRHVDNGGAVDLRVCSLLPVEQTVARFWSNPPACSSHPSAVCRSYGVLHAVGLKARFLGQVHMWAGCFLHTPRPICQGLSPLQDVLTAPSAPGTAARLAAAQVAALQKRLAAPTASLQLLGFGDTLAQQPMLAPVSRCGRRSAAVRSLAAMLRVASVEAPALRFSAVEITAAASTSDASLVAAAVPAAPDAQGQSLSAGAWLGPRLIDRQQEAAGGTPGLGSEGQLHIPSRPHHRHR